MRNKKIISDVIIKRVQRPVPKKYPEKEIEPSYAKPQFKPISTKFQNESGFKSWRIAGIAVFAVVFSVTAVILIALRLSRIELVLTPKSTIVAVNKSVMLSRSAGVNSVEFSTLALPYPMSGSFASEEKKSIENKARGTVVIFNKSSKDPQVLIASTRIESPEGKIYRIPSTIIIPGTKVEGGKIIPGSKEVDVAADKPGAEYNIGLTDFTIPGFKGSPKFESVFARSKTEMSGGYVGNSQIITKNAVDAAVAELVSEANKNLKNIISKKLPEDSMFLSGSEEFAVISVETNPKLGMPISDGRKFEVKLNAEARGTIVKETDLAKMLLKNDVDLASLGGGEIRIKNINELDIKLLGYKFDATSLKMEVKGNATVEAAIDIDYTKNKLMNNRIGNSGDVLNLFPAVFRAELKYHPFWAGSLPGGMLNPMSRGRIDIQIISR
ncbi:hypothetical protein A2W54_00310 [Candidatus Giovannonibacteria bacterium RIFCSPHIGHO2_02_43_13]|uniref:Baseplate protein J-like domain-containing protein n=1 Tax=Candidatus Giovannonibacteria bacterium RIFCSPHIGHO2_02_43_13 TaxID=1798330 RepID=A0A1F5WQW2_9BACT|nr:MAG: hypothetical protein UW28_C0005G0005 [Parcubacteria group bacterium GW2011_GWA2_44_13]OGF72362.1 MAG: hypothetical protein A3E06_02425 [Candidatus Giovannonibacteria bacterium RIFCSPHIGHO2_12_FULL_44_42]OGF77641.1 MAG: hypothetical protein A2W54_00310 [Candidatus Giovannonibacteria bacterium RIFCSPHIGHO2_02_43_13]OGF88606.1 MAG: hypothetical protein A3I94_01240 [Candidatus Giovannonibacteria bacterium RIFCSPLOWO2_02_FULL_43_54]OGF97005.1 MAG: hypothetical protein A3H08_03725 [Candidatus